MKILLVDDDIPFITILEETLKNVGYIVDKAYDGEEAIKKTKEFRPDVILLDVVLPKKDGFEVISELKTAEETKNIKVILCTGFSTVEVDRGFALGADDCIYKPFDVEFLIKRINKIISRS